MLYKGLRVMSFAYDHIQKQISVKYDCSFLKISIF